MATKGLKSLVFAAWLGLICATGVSQTTRPTDRVVDVLTVDGPINPIVAQYLADRIDAASPISVECIVIKIDTPGGLVPSMEDIVKAILKSEVPVITLVTPRGAQAASAGSYIVMASHIAAMTPGTIIGSATPVDAQGQKASEKMVNNMASYMVGLAKETGRNVEWAEKAVREGASLDAEDALRNNVIDLTASGLTDLLAKVNGREVQIAGRTVRLNTLNAELRYQSMNWIQKLFHTLAHPEIAYILLMLGIWGLYFELANPGAVLPGVIGGLCLILGLLALQILPIQPAGGLLILLAIVLFIAELKITSHGILTAGGIIAFVLGSFLLFPASPYGKVPWPMILTSSGLTAAFFSLVLYLVVKAQRSKVVMGVERLSGMQGVAQSDLGPTGIALIDGEQWSVESVAGSIPRGQTIEVVNVEGLTLKVKPKDRK